MTLKIQKRLSGKTEKPYKKICCEPCWNAKGKKCVCRCNGLYHGLGRQEKRKDDILLTGDVLWSVLNKIKDRVCRWCGEQLPPDVYAFPHSAGWKIYGFESLMWLYIPCRKCGYDWAIWKLGVARDEEFSP